jgi:hypothetical protein
LAPIEYCTPGDQRREHNLPQCVRPFYPAQCLSRWDRRSGGRTAAGAAAASRREVACRGTPCAFRRRQLPKRSHRFC